MKINTIFSLHKITFRVLWINFSFSNFLVMFLFKKCILFIEGLKTYICVALGHVRYAFSFVFLIAILWNTVIDEETEPEEGWDLLRVRDSSTVVLLSLGHLLSLHSFHSNPRSLSALFFCKLLKTNKQRTNQQKNPALFFLSLAFFTNLTSFLVLVFLIMVFIPGFLWKLLEIDVL